MEESEPFLNWKPSKWKIFILIDLFSMQILCNTMGISNQWMQVKNDFQVRAQKENAIYPS